MAAVTTVFTTINGMLVHEDRGGAETEYVADPLGSLVQTRNSSGTKTYEAEYWPYGEVQASTGTNPSSWGYVGLLGYLTDSATMLYIRARTLSTSSARWITTDRFWPSQKAYPYADDNPISVIDPSGMASLWDVLKKCGPAVTSALSDLLFNKGSIWGFVCKLSTGCLAAIIGFIIAAALTGLTPPIAGCIGGAIASVLTSVTSWACDGQLSKPGLDWGCKIGVALLQALYGCLSGLVGGALDENKVKESVGLIIDAFRGVGQGAGFGRADKNCEHEEEPKTSCRSGYRGDLLSSPRSPVFA